MSLNVLLPELQSLARFAVYVLLAGLPAGVAGAQNLQASATVGSNRVQTETTFQLTVTATQSGRSTPAKPTIDWPNWESLGLTRIPGGGSSVSTSTSSGQTRTVHSETVCLQASRPGSVLIPPIPVRGTNDVVLTAPITVTIDLAAPPVPTPNAAPQVAPAMPPAETPGGTPPWGQKPTWGPPPWSQDPNFGFPPAPARRQAPAGQDAWRAFQIASGAALFWVFLIVVVVVFVVQKVQARQRMPQSAPPPGPDAPAIQQLEYLSSQSDLRSFYAEAGVQLRALLGRATGLNLTGRSSVQLATVVHQRFGDPQLLQAVQSCAARCESVTAGTSGAQVDDANRDLHLLRYLAQLPQVGPQVGTIGI